MTIDFDQQKVFAQSIEVEDIGNCALRCTNQEFEDYYVVTQTVMGKTFILKFGPLVADLDAIDSEFSLVYKKIDYKEAVIMREINVLVNDAKKKINQIDAVAITDALQMIPTSDKFVPC